ncbi:hypothetical protein MRX96_000648 [Rhipicephalus microplus]
MYASAQLIEDSVQLQGIEAATAVRLCIPLSVLFFFHWPTRPASAVHCALRFSSDPFFFDSAMLPHTAYCRLEKSAALLSAGIYAENATMATIGSLLSVLIRGANADGA